MTEFKTDAVGQLLQVGDTVVVMSASSGSIYTTVTKVAELTKSGIKYQGIIWRSVDGEYKNVPALRPKKYNRVIKITGEQ